MSRGAPDYMVQNYSVAVQSFDMADLAPFVTGCARIDNKGRVIIYDDFVNGILRWNVDSEGGGSNPDHTFEAGKCYGQNGAVRLRSNVADGGSYLSHSFTVPLSSTYGIEFSAYLYGAFPDLSLSFLVNTDGGVSKAAALKIEHNTGDVYIYTGLAWVKIVDHSSITYIQNHFVTYKLVIDVTTGTYTRLYVGAVGYDVSEYELGNGGILLAGTVNTMFSSYGYAPSFFNSVYLGHVIITVDEP